MKHLITWLSLFPLATLSCFFPLDAEAQITPDDTLGDENSVVTQDNINGIPSDKIDGGAARGANLFHSFQDFNIGAGRGAYFGNPAGIANIFSRVTGSNPSNLLGTLGVLGNANLFFINPNGIFFGENASLDLRGSFFASTADSLGFKNGFEFSASNPQSPPLLTVSIPIGANFRDNPRDIVNQASGNGLQVKPGENISLIGGNVTFDGGIILAPDGRIELGGLITAGKIDFTNNSSLIFPENVTRGDITLSNFFVDVTYKGKGEISLNGRNVFLTSGSRLIAGVRPNLVNSNEAKGEINIDATNEIIASQASVIQNQVFSGATGDTGNIDIQTNSLTLTEGSLIDASTFGNGSSGKIKIDATDIISVDGFGNKGIPSGFLNNVGSENTVGNAGEIQINTKNLTLTNGGIVNSVTFGQGNAGKIILNASDSIIVDGKAENPFFNSSIVSGIANTAKGNSGGIEIDAVNLNLINKGIIRTETRGRGDAGNITINLDDALIIGNKNQSDLDFSQITSETSGIGDAGNINIQARFLSLQNGGQIDASTFRNGNAGKIIINTIDSIYVGNTNKDEVGSGIYSEIGTKATGISGGIEITTSNLFITKTGQISANVFGEGNAGKITINAADTISIDGINSGISNLVEETAKGNSGGIEITTANLSLANGSLIDTSTLGKGNAGKITINASDTISLDGFNSVVFSEISNNAQGNSGGIEINTANLYLTNQGTINSRTLSEENAGNIDIQARALFLENAGEINSSTSGAGNGGNITINVDDSITISNSSAIVASTFGSSGSFADRLKSGDGGNIKIQGQSLSLKNGARINSVNSGISFAKPGNITIDVNNAITLIGESQTGSVSSISTDTYGLGDGGKINIDANSLLLENGAEISSSSDLTGLGNGGNIDIEVNEDVFLSGKSQNSSASKIATDTSGDGNGGNIDIQARSLLLENGAEIKSNVTSGLITPSSGEGGNITLQIIDLLSLRNNGKVSAQASENANGGNVTINANDGFVIAFPNQNSDIFANAAQGNGGNIDITTQGIFGLEERQSFPPNTTNDIDASSEFGLQGTFSLTTPNVDPTSGLIELPQAVGDPSDQISQNPCEQTIGSEFIITGKGGIPPSPHDNLSSDVVRVDLIEPVATRRGGDGETRGQENVGVSVPEEIVPAQGWVFNDKGEVMLTAYDPTNTGVKRAWQQPTNSCPAP